VTEWQKQRVLDGSIKSKIFAALIGSKELLVEAPEVGYMIEI